MQTEMEDASVEVPGAWREAAAMHLRAAVAVIATQRKSQLIVSERPRSPLRDEVIGLMDDLVFPSFVGAPGELCEVCKGTGRKPD